MCRSVFPCRSRLFRGLLFALGLFVVANRAVAAGAEASSSSALANASIGAKPSECNPPWTGSPGELPWQIFVVTADLDMLDAVLELLDGAGLEPRFLLPEHDAATGIVRCVAVVTYNPSFPASRFSAEDLAVGLARERERRSARMR